MKSFEVRNGECGISLIALVITIIVIIILAAIAFNSSTGTIGKANYSKFVSNISEVEQAINEKMIEVKGAMLAKGSQITDGQVFNYVAKGGKTDDDFVVESRTPDYTIIEKSADIGIKLPVMKVNTSSETNVEVKYAVTKNGKVFIWPPFPSENAYNIRDKEFVDSSLVSSSGDIDITVAGTTFKLQIDGNSKIENRELLDDGLSKKEFEEIASKIKVGDYVNYVPTSNTVETDSTKTGYRKEVLSTDKTASWRILSIDRGTGRVIITTDGPVNNVMLSGGQGYLYGASELHRLCEKLYSNEDKKILAKSLTIEELKPYIRLNDKKVVGYAWYSSETPDSDLKSIVIGEKIYSAKKHTSELKNGLKCPRFYTWDNEVGKTENGMALDDYKELKDGYVLITKTIGAYEFIDDNETVGEIIGGTYENRSWLPMTCINAEAQKESVYFDMCTIHKNSIGGHVLFASDGMKTGNNFSLHPVVSFSSGLLDIASMENDGSSSSKAWNIK